MMANLHLGLQFTHDIAIRVGPGALERVEDDVGVRLRLLQQPAYDNNT